MKFAISAERGKWTVTIGEESATGATIEEATELLPPGPYQLAVKALDHLHDHLSMEVWENRSFIERILGRVL